MKCPDCDSIKLLGIESLEEEGDGKCSQCHGTGAPDLLDRIGHETVGVLIDAEEPVCTKCNGSGVCQTCGGTGTIPD